MNTLVLSCSTILLGAAIVSAVTVYFIKRVAERNEILDLPNQRSCHTCPTPRGGGLAIVLVAIAGMSLYCVLAADGPRLAIVSYLVAAVMLAVVSLLDDLYSLKNSVRFAIHAGCAVLVLLTSGYLHMATAPFVGVIDIGVLGAALTLFWIVGLTNGYNFMDGVDGIAGVQGLVAGLGWCALGLLLHQATISLLGLLIAGGCLGFLVFNWPPAKIFMGDVGSTFLGFSFAFLTVYAGRENPRAAVAGLLLVWPFVFDSCATMLRRLFNGENITTPHRTHLYQRLYSSGLAHGKISCLYGGLASICGLFAFPVIAGASRISDGGAAIAAMGSSLALWYFVRRCEKKADLVVDDVTIPTRTSRSDDDESCDSRFKD